MNYDAVETYEQARESFMAKDFDMAEKLFGDAAELYLAERDREGGAKCQLNRGICLMKLEKFDEAMQALKGAINLIPTYIKAKYHIAKLYDQLGKTDIAYRIAKKAFDDSMDDGLKQLADTLYQKLNKGGSGGGGVPPVNRADYYSPPADHPLLPGQQQARFVKTLMEQQQQRGLQVGDAHYAVDAVWWRRWAAATGYDGPDKPKFPVGWKLKLAPEGEAAPDDESGAAAAGGAAGPAADPTDDGPSSPRIEPVKDEDLPLLGPIDNERLCLREGEEDFDEEELARRVAAKARKQLEESKEGEGAAGGGGGKSEDEDDGAADKHRGAGDDEEGSGQTAAVIDAIPGTDGTAPDAPKKPVLLPPRIRPGASLRRHFVLIGEGPYRALQRWYGEKAKLRRVVYDRAAPVDGSSPGDDHFPDCVVDLFPERRIKQLVEEEEMQRMGVTASAAGGGAVKMDDGVERSSLTNRSKVLTLYPKSTDTRNMFGMDYRSHRIAGAMGLRNLGNTCFMNSALQCVKATWPLSSYLMADLHKIDENPGNPLGTGCNLSREYAFLVNYMHYERGSSVAPTGVKAAVGRFRRDFAGFQQHDSHELLSFLLDAIHEDLNRVRKKPATTKPEGHGKDDDHEVAEKTWATHLQRNDSIVTDCMMGQLRSELTCPSCGNVSVQFDPYTSLSLPIAGPRHRKMAMTVQPQPQAPREVLEKGLDVTIKQGRREDMYTGKVTYKRVYASLQRNTDARAMVERTSSLTKVGESAQDIVLGGDKTEVRMYSYKERGTVGIPLVPHESVRKIPGKHWLLCIQTGPRSTPLPVKQEDGSWTGVDPFDPSPEACEAALALAGEIGDAAATRRMDVEVRLHNPIQRGDVGLPRVISLPSWASPLSLRRRYAELLAGAIRGVPDRVGALRKAKEEAETTGVPAEVDEDEASPGALLTEAEAFARRAIMYACTDGRSEPVHTGEIPVPVEEARTTVAQLLGESVADPEDPNFYKSGMGLKLVRVRFDEDLRKASFDAVSYDHEFTHPSVKAKVRSEAVSLDDCMDAFCTPEVLDAQNEWYCSACKNHVRATKHMQPWKIPDILVVHMKRFSSGNHYYARKLEDYVDFPLVGWDLTKHNLERKHAKKATKATPEAASAAGGSGGDSSGAAAGGGGGGSDDGAAAAADGEGGDLESIYDCYGVVNHFGSMGFGHYTAYANHYVARYGAGEGPGGGGLGPQRHVGTEETANASWLEFDDSRVSDGIRTSSVKSSSAYILFYRRRGSHMP